MTFKEYLSERHLTGYRLAQNAGVSNSAVNFLVSGRRTIDNCSMKNGYLIAKALGIPMEELVERFGNDERIRTAGQD